MTHPAFDVGAAIFGSPASPRALVSHAAMLAGYADGVEFEKGNDREAYLSHFVFGSEMRRHYAANGNSVAGFAGPCSCRWLVLDIDRPDLSDALADARKLVAFLRNRYPEADSVPVWFTGQKGFHVAIELIHKLVPAVGFQHVAKTFAEALAARAGIVIDTSIYDLNHIIRLPNTRHAKTEMFKRRIDADDLFRLDMDGIRRIAKTPAGDGIPTVRSVPPQLPIDWGEAESSASLAADARVVIRREYATSPDTRAPRYFRDFMAFGCAKGERHTTLFRCAAWMQEQSFLSVPALISAVLTEPALDCGLTPADVCRQIRCGIDHAAKQRAAADPQPDVTADPDAFERWAMRHESDPLGLIIGKTGGTKGGRR